MFSVYDKIESLTCTVSAPRMILEAVLLLFSQGGTTVVLGTTAALLITEVLTGARSEQTCNK
jgi:hypothetical protein